MILDTRQAFMLYIVVLTFVLTFLFLSINQKRIVENNKEKIRLINNRLSLGKRRYNYADKYIELKSYGFDERFKQPVYYYFIKILIGLIGAITLSLLNPALSILGFILGYIFFDWYAKEKNKSDNDKMSSDIEMVYNVLSTQLKNGVYVGIALSELTELISYKRLKDAFIEFDKHFKIGDLTLKENIKEFEEKFCNDEISTLCMIINQSEENGHSKDILQDLINQIHDMEEIKYSKIKARTDNVLTIFMMVLFADFMFFILYIFVNYIMEMV